MRSLTLAPAGERLKALLLGAHPDDIEIGCFGALESLRASGADVEISWAVLSGDGGRADEARASAEAILADGFASGSFHQGRFPDAHFAARWGDVKEWVARLGEGFTPHVVFTHHRDDRHQDHRLVAELSWNHFRDALILEYEVPKYDGELGAPNAFVPMPEELCRKKSEHLLRFFPSQKEKSWFTAETFQGLARLRGVECGTRLGYAEAFHVRKVLLGGGAT